MNKRLGCTIVSVFAFFALLSLMAVLGFLFIRRQNERARSHLSVPMVLVTEPAAGSSFPAGSYLEVSATAFSKTPLIQVELWLDGELIEAQESLKTGGLTTFNANFSILVPQGEHSFLCALSIPLVWSVSLCQLA